MRQSKAAAIILVSLCVGILIGGFLFSRSQPRSLLSLHQCQNCFSHEQILGLLASVGIQRFPDLMPFKVFETDKTIAFRNPFASEPVHYIIIPKQDIKDIGQVSAANAAYFQDALFVTRWIIDKEKLFNYVFYTNGPGQQDVTYLHFHLVVPADSRPRRNRATLLSPWLLVDSSLCAMTHNIDKTTMQLSLN